MTDLMPSWMTSANSADNPFPLNNLPHGVFSTDEGPKRCGIALGDTIVDVAALEAVGFLSFEGTLQTGSWNAFMALGPAHWRRLREDLMALLAAGSTRQAAIEPHVVSMQDATLHMPFSVSEFTDFYSGRHHATNIGTMFRGADNALPPNWLHIPIGYNGRASSVVVSGTPVRRPRGQIKRPQDTVPRFGPSRRFDIELEMGAIVGQPSDGPIGVQQAFDNIFGYVLLNDWSARDIQAWEYQPLGPFQAKATATTIGPWIVSTLALEPFRCATPEREKPLLPYLQEPGPMLFDIDLQVVMQPEGEAENVISRTNMKELYFSSAQQLAHHTSSGCPMRVGDLLGSGTISGPMPGSRGSLVELSWGGETPFVLDDGSQRSFVEDGDTMILRGQAVGDGFLIGFGDCAGQILPADDA